MIADGTVFATVAVKDINKGKKFYGGTLGLKQTDENPGGVTYQSGSGKLFVYASGTAGSGQATCASWAVDDVKAVTEELKGRGIKFEVYDMPGASWDGEVMAMGGMKSAWFKDPDGNILNVSHG